MRTHSPPGLVVCRVSLFCESEVGANKNMDLTWWPESTIYGQFGIHFSFHIKKQPNKAYEKVQTRDVDGIPLLFRSHILLRHPLP